MFSLILFGCLFNVVFLGLFSRFLRTVVLFRIVILSLCICFFVCHIMFYEVVIMHTPCAIPLFSWIQVFSLNITWTLLFDPLSASLVYIVVFISLLVHLYSLDYMSGDPHIVRFMFLLSLFTLFMLVMVTANNVLQLFFGWEGVGLSSYLLISFWFSRSEANKSALKALIVNRFGDFGVYLGLLLTVYLFRAVEFGTIFSTCPLYEHTVLTISGYEVRTLTLIALSIFLGTIGKSAQIGLHMWLPDAMEGPTPVSALLHAATMVTAGVFILLRFSPIFSYVPYLLLFVAFVGSLTSLFAGFSALVQYDIKKIIAYSTCSHLGIMLIFCGLSYYNVSLFHLFNHAFFKALLFLSAGAIIHALKNEQDIRKMGGVLVLMPFTYCMFVIGSLSLIGFPFLSGFFSKDVGWELLFTNFMTSYGYIYTAVNPTVLKYFFVYIFIVFNIILLLSVAYSFRLIIVVFSSYYRGFRSQINGVHEPTFRMLLPLIVLSIFSIFAGYLFKDLFIGIGSPTWLQSFPDLSYVHDVAGLKELYFSPDILNGIKFVLRIFTFVLSISFMLWLICAYRRLQGLYVTQLIWGSASASKFLKLGMSKFSISGFFGRITVRRCCFFMLLLFYLFAFLYFVKPFLFEEGLCFLVGGILTIASLAFWLSVVYFLCSQLYIRKLFYIIVHIVFIVFGVLRSVLLYFVIPVLDFYFESRFFFWLNETRMKKIWDENEISMIILRFVVRAIVIVMFLNFLAQAVNHGGFSEVFAAMFLQRHDSGWIAHLVTPFVFSAIVVFYIRRRHWINIKLQPFVRKEFGWLIENGWWLHELRGDTLLGEGVNLDRFFTTKSSYLFIFRCLVFLRNVAEIVYILWIRDTIIRPFVSFLLFYFDALQNAHSRFFLFLSPFKYFRALSNFLAYDHFIYRKVSGLFLYLSHHITFKLVDRGFLEHFGPFGIVKVLRSLSSSLFSFVSCNFYSFIFFVIFSVLFSLFGYFFLTFDDFSVIISVLILFGCLKDKKK